MILLTSPVYAEAEWVRGANAFDNIYCLLTGCTIIGNLIIDGNLTVEGNFVNVTVVDYNVTGSLDVNGPVTATNFSGDLFWGNLSQYPAACSAGDFVSGVGDTLTCGTPGGNTHVAGDPPYLYNDSTTMFFNETKLNLTIDARENDTNTHVNGSPPYLYNDSTTMYFNETKLNLTIDARENDTNTHVNGSPPYLYNDSTTMYFNETKLNLTIDARENDTNTHVNGSPPYLYNDTTTMYFNETKLNLTIDARENDTNTHVAGSLPWLSNDSTTMYFNETHFNDSVPLLNYWTASVFGLYYDSGNVTIGGASSEGILGLVSADTETISSIDNTGVLGDSVIKFQLGGTTLLTLGIRDAGTNDPFEFNYADGLDSSPELTITTDDILIGTPTVGAASLIFNNKLENTCPFMGDVNVDDTNYLVLPVATCTYDDFSNGIEGQLLVIICPRPTAVTITVADTNREIGLSGGNDFVCANAGDTLTLFMGPPPFNEWFELSRSFNS
jgi:hypothetical protein